MKMYSFVFCTQKEIPISSEETMQAKVREGSPGERNETTGG